MTPTVSNYNGTWVVSAVVRGYLVTRRYVGYSKREARSGARVPRGRFVSQQGGLK